MSIKSSKILIAIKYYYMLLLMLFILAKLKFIKVKSGLE